MQHPRHSCSVVSGRVVLSAMSTIDDIEHAVERLSMADLAAFRVWFEALVSDRLGAGCPDALVEPWAGLSDHEKARLMARARERSRRLLDDPVDRVALDDLIDLQAENANPPAR